jgi:adenylate cyclase
MTSTTPEKRNESADRRPRRRLAAVMFADMVEYSRRLEQDEKRNTALATKSVQLFKSLIGDYGGKVANVAGDGLLALFESAEEALRFAVQVQEEFRDQAVWGDGEPMMFRIGLSLGEITISHGNVQGHCVNVAARLQMLAEPGEIYVTAAVRDAARGFAEAALRSLGPQRLKNISDEVEVFAVSRPGRKTRRLSETPPATAFQPSRQPSVAVLALANLSGDLANDHLCEGVAEDVIANLSRFRNLMVIARHSAFIFSLKTGPAREIGRRLGVSYLLGGSLRRSGHRLRIAVELIGTESENVLWSDRFDIGINELFELQDEITTAVASRLALQIDFVESRREAQFPRDLRAYGLVLRGQHLMLRFTKEINAHARRLFDEAIEIAPDYSRAYSSLSRTHNLDWRYSWSQAPDESLNTAVELARRAVEGDPLDARGFAELGFAHLYKKQIDEALSDYGRAIALNPNDADIIAEYADCLSYAGEPDKSLGLLERAMRLNPYYPDWYLWCLADAYWTLDRPADVVSTVQRMQDPAEGRRLLAVSLAQLGLIDEARAQGREILRRQPGFTVSLWKHRPPHRDPAMIEKFAEGLRKAGLPE